VASAPFEPAPSDRLAGWAAEVRFTAPLTRLGGFASRCPRKLITAAPENCTCLLPRKRSVKRSRVISQTHDLLFYYVAIQRTPSPKPFTVIWFRFFGIHAMSRRLCSRSWKLGFEPGTFGRTTRLSCLSSNWTQLNSRFT